MKLCIFIFFPGRCTLDDVTKDADELIEYFCNNLFDLNPHDFIAKKQSEYLKSLKNNLKDGEVIVISDFSENYTFVIQEAVQGYHWTNDQCTIHPFSIYYRQEGAEKPKFQSFVIISENTQHNITAVNLFQTKLLDFLKKKLYCDQYKKIYFFSDGAAGQYKNKKNFFNICQFKKEYNIEAEWHFFASYHGKSPCDALGGTVKRMATSASLQRFNKDQITTAKALYEFLKNKATQIQIEVDFCSEQDHSHHERKLRNKYTNIKTLAGTRKFHSIIPISDSAVSVKNYSFSTVSENLSLI